MNIIGCGCERVPGVAIIGRPALGALVSLFTVLDGPLVAAAVFSVDGRSILLGGGPNIIHCGCERVRGVVIIGGPALGALVSLFMALKGLVEAAAILPIDGRSSLRLVETDPLAPVRHVSASLAISDSEELKGIPLSFCRFLWLELFCEGLPLTGGERPADHLRFLARKQFGRFEAMGYRDARSLLILLQVVIPLCYKLPRRSDDVL